MRKLAAAVALILILAASLPAGATYGTVFVRDWRNMAACQCLTDAWVAPGAYARLSPDGTMMAYEIIDWRMSDQYGREDYVGEAALFIGPKDYLLSDYVYELPKRPIYWVFPHLVYRWSRDGRYVYYNAMLDTDLARLDSWATFRLDLVTGRTERMPWRGRVVMDTSPDGRWVVVIEALESDRVEKIGPHYVRERNVVAIDLLTGREIMLAERAMIRTGLQDAAISFNEQGDRLAMPILGKVYLYTFDGSNFRHYDTIQLGGLNSAAVWDPHGDYLIVQRDTAYLPYSRFHDPLPKYELYWVDLRTKESGPIWDSNFSQSAPWFVPGTRTLAFNSQIGDTIDELPMYLVNRGERLPPWTRLPLWRNRCFCPEDD